MNSEEYLTQRVEEQIRWYDGKSKTAQKWFRWLRGVEILCAASITVLAGYATSHLAIPVVTGLCGALVVVLAAFQSLGQHQENWIQYRTTCESIRHEKYLFVTATQPYHGKDAFALFVERVESLISKEHAAWSQHVRVAAERSKVQESEGDSPT